jgi:ABC-type transport system involved in multi-copper enzyme maturation permease subunit
VTASDVPLPALSGTRPARPTFNGALRGELYKVRRNRPTVVMTALALVFLTLIMLLFATLSQYHLSLTQHPVTAFYSILHPLELFFTAGAGIVMLLTGSRLLGMEYDLGTVRVLFSRGTGRQQLLAAKITALSIYALLLLVGIVALSALGTVVVVEHQTGSLSALQGLPIAAWENVGLAILSCAVSEFSCLLLSVALAALLRSVTAAMLLAMLFFPIDNTLSTALNQLTVITKSNVWKDVTAFLYGPNLNHLPTLLQVHQTAAISTLATPSVPTSLLETVVVIGAWWLFLLFVAMTSLARHDVLS